MYERPSMFQGRNGSDQLSVFLVAIALVLVIIYPFFPLDYVRLILCGVALALIAWALFRMFSSNIAKRREENAKFLAIFGKKHKSNGTEDINYREVGEKTEKEKKKEAKQRAKQEKEAEKARKKAKKQDLKTHAYFKCPKCSTELRVPKGKGKIRITCPKCGEQFVEKT